MNIQKTMLATALLAFLTGCGSSGGGSSQPTSNNEVKNDQATQAQVEKQKNEVQALKTQLAQAQSNQKQIEEKLKLAEQSHKKDLSSAKANLASAQDNLNKAQAALKQAEFQSAVSQKERDSLQKQLRQAEQDLSKAQQEKLLAEKELSNKLTEANKLMSRKEVLDFALHNGLHTQDSEEFADDFQNKPKSYVIDQLLDVHKIIAIKNLARRYGLPEADVRQFAKENKNKTLEESTKLLDSKKEEIAQKREALNKEVFELAKAKGLEEWEARNFAYGRHHSDKAGALEDLNKYLTEKAERENKINELINLAKEKGLEEWEARNFAYDNLNNDREQVQKNLAQIENRKSVIKELTKLAKEHGLTDIDANRFANENVDKESSTILEHLEKFIMDSAVEQANEIKLKVGDNIPQGFTPKYDDKTQSIYNQQAKEIGKERTYKDIYNQRYSIVAAKYESYDNSQNPESSGVDYSLSIQPISGRFGGFETKILPTEGSAIYQGKAFTIERQGNLTYNVDFARREGEGNSTELKDLGTLHLDKGNIVRPFNYEGWGLGINSSITAKEWQGQNVKGQYQLFFYGPNAEEIAGVAGIVQVQSDSNAKKLSDVLPTSGGYSGYSENLLQELPNTYRNDPNGGFGVDIGFGGTRGEIQK